MNDTDFEKCKRYAQYLLGYSAKSAQDLFNRLTRKGYSEETAAKTLAVMTEYGYVNDREFAERRVQALLNKNMGGRLIRWKLREHGISDEIIGEVTQDLSSDDEGARLYALALQYYVKGKGDHRSKLRRAADALRRKGHEEDTIAAVIRKIDEQESE